MFGWEADALFLTALLTVISFSMQDKIVVFDRIRENVPKYRGETFSAIVNRSIMETIHQSLATQLNAIFIMVAILLFGGGTIKQFHRHHAGRPGQRHLLFDLQRRGGLGRLGRVISGHQEGPAA